MSCEVLTDKIVKTKKSHMCFACGRLFPAGSIMNYQTNISYGDFSAIYTCDTCQKLFTKASRDLFDDNDQVYPEFCVCNALEYTEYKTPEEWLQSIS